MCAGLLKCSFIQNNIPGIQLEPSTLSVVAIISNHPVHTADLFQIDFPAQIFMDSGRVKCILHNSLQIAMKSVCPVIVAVFELFILPLHNSGTLLSPSFHHYDTASSSSLSFLHCLTCARYLTLFVLESTQSSTSILNLAFLFIYKQMHLTEHDLRPSLKPVGMLVNLACI